MRCYYHAWNPSCVLLTVSRWTTVSLVSITPHLPSNGGCVSRKWYVNGLTTMIHQSNLVQCEYNNNGPVWTRLTSGDNLQTRVMILICELEPLSFLLWLLIYCITFSVLSNDESAYSNAVLGRDNWEKVYCKCSSCTSIRGFNAIYIKYNHTLWNIDTFYIY